MKRVRRALDSSGIETDIVETPLARTAADAAQAIGCDIDQIAKSIIFCGQTSGVLYLFITAGSNAVDPAKAAALAGKPLGKADAAVIRAQTGFSNGGVAPVGHLNEITTFADPRLQDFDVIWAAEALRTTYSTLLQTK